MAKMPANLANDRQPAGRDQATCCSADVGRGVRSQAGRRMNTDGQREPIVRGQAEHTVGDEGTDDGHREQVGAREEVTAVASSSAWKSNTTSADRRHRGRAKRIAPGRCRSDGCEQLPVTDGNLRPRNEGEGGGDAEQHALSGLCAQARMERCQTTNVPTRPSVPTAC